MSGSSKLAIILGGFGVCFYLGWFFPLLWLIWIVGTIVVLLTPTKTIERPQVPAQANYQQVDISQPVSDDIVQKLEVLLASETNEDIKEGIRRSLSVVQSTQDVQYHDENIMYYPIELAPQPVVAMSEAELADHKKRQELKNINTILYTASFLLVGAAALFISFSDVDSITRFILTALGALTFYVAGLAIYSKSQRLIPAATAFIGTGLALIPFVGLAFNSFVIDNPSLSWWLTSIVGLIAFLIALYRMRSNPMIYLTLGFVFSVATSSVAVADAPFVWYFVSIIFVSSGLLYLGVKAPKFVPLRMRIPLETSGHIATPVALIGSLLLIDSLSVFDYTLIAGVGAVHYLVNALNVATDKTRFPYWVAGRGLSILFAALFAYALSEDFKVVSVVLIAAALLTHMYSIRAIRREPREIGWLWAAQGLLVVSLIGLYENITHVSGLLMIITGLSVHQLYSTRRFEVAIPGIIAAMALPISILRGVIEPALDFGIVATVTLCMAYAAFGMRFLLQGKATSFVNAVSALYIAFIAETILIGMFGSDMTAYGSVLGLSAILLYLASFVEKEPMIHLISNIIFAAGVVLILDAQFDHSVWTPVMAGGIMAGIWYGLSLYFRRPEAAQGDNDRRSIIMAASAISALTLAGLFAMFSASETVAAGALLGCAAAGLLAYEGMIRKLYVCYEIAIYMATFSVQRLVADIYPEANWLVYTHWWALSIALAAVLHYKRTKSGSIASTRGILALLMLSLPSAIAAIGFDPTGGYRVLFLFEHVILAIAGLSLNKRLVVQWGAIGVGLAVLYMLRGYTYLLLVLIAIGLIGLAIWKLTTAPKDHS